MKKITHVVLLGAGAIGVLPAAQLAELDSVKLSVAASGERLERYRRDGIYLNDKLLGRERYYDKAFGSLRKDLRGAR